MTSFRINNAALLGAVSLFAVAAASRVAAEPQVIVLASTTSVENSGLLAHILPQFTSETGITVHVVAQGTGQALAKDRKSVV